MHVALLLYRMPSRCTCTVSLGRSAVLITRDDATRFGSRPLIGAVMISCCRCLQQEESAALNRRVSPGWEWDGWEMRDERTNMKTIKINDKIALTAIGALRTLRYQPLQSQHMACAYIDCWCWCRRHGTAWMREYLIVGRVCSVESAVCLALSFSCWV